MNRLMKYGYSIILLTCTAIPGWWIRISAGQKPSLKERAAEARSKGLQELRIPMHTDRLGENEDIHSLDPSFSIVEGMPTERFVEVGTDFIRTWYAFKIRTLVRNATQCNFCATDVKAPHEFSKSQGSPVVYVLEGGGTATVDGIRITETSDADAPLTIGRNYLLVLAGPVRRGGVAFLSAGPSAVALISDDGKLSPAFTHESTTLSGSISSFGKIQAIRSQFRSSPIR